MNNAILDQLNKGNANVEAIQNQLFDVINVPLHTNQDLFTPPNAFGIYKATGGEPFGVLGKDYAPQQPKALFESFVGCLMDNTSADLSKIRYHEMKGGAKIRFEVPLKTIGFTNMAGKQDESIISLNIQTGFDGNTATSLYLTMLRMVCTNGMKANFTEFNSKFRNTIGNVGKIQILCDEVTKAIDSSTELEEAIDHIRGVQITTKMKNDFIEKVMGIKVADRDSLTIRKRNILQRVEESMAIEIARSGGNLWGLVNGITLYTNHGFEGRDQNQINEYIYSQTGELTNKKAMEVALAMAN